MHPSQRVGDLCIDVRPPVRKSAGQTLFSTLSAHGDLLKPRTWNIVLWKVWFYLITLFSPNFIDEFLDGISV